MNTKNILPGKRKRSIVDYRRLNDMFFGDADEKELLRLDDAEDFVVAPQGLSHQIQNETLIEEVKEMQITQQQEMAHLTDAEKCAICKDRPLTGCIVHGNYSHVYSCYSCALQLLKDKS